MPVLQKLLQRSLAGYDLEVRPATTADHAELIEASEVNVFRRAQRARNDCITYRVRIGDVPGTISIAPLRASAFRCSSAALGDLKPSSRAMSARVGG